MIFNLATHIMALVKDYFEKTHLYQQHDITEYQHYQDRKLVDKLGIIKNMIDEKQFWNFIFKNKIKMKGYENDLKLINLKLFIS